LKGYVQDGRQTGFATNKHPSGIDQFIEVKVIHSVCVQYGRPDVRDNHKRAAVQYFQGHVRAQYIAQMNRKDNVHFGTNPVDKGPLEMIFQQLEFKPWFLYFWRDEFKCPKFYHHGSVLRGGALE